ncbi:SulP family inorganic anion transporter [Gordonia hongkongensis]|uniref:SulP family inorganic anion transporter n=1 Tax=Gordonia hongkongensis TaxID=1701090 RepID=A0AAX3T7V4_9ACTN|nr:MULTISPECIES: SulP family inorganic anion transporter [Gordonia]OCW84036.1 transporter [Nocardia farcinica]KSU59192.1 transporter [Gordonia sp. SGD-V-85]MBN0971138.1 SulP family inorganic anion transporter [Gordonia sp. BP-119]MBN0981758.1 SulP family inorganic anion transporter [Gordonia sp. BP-94]MDT0221681.1 SulP family inorganic anion transporter [Gordonia sp. AC31]
MQPETVSRFLPGLGVLRSYERSWLKGDIVAGIVLTALLIPAGMGYAEVAGLPPVTGLYATVIPLLVYAVVGPSRILVLGPDSSLAPIIAASIIPLAAFDAERIALAGVLAIEVGLVLLIGGLLRLGFVTDLLSKPIRIGYLNGIALVVVLSQLPKLLGFSVDGDSVLQEAIDIVRGVTSGEAELLPTVIGVSCLVLIFALKFWRKAIPGVLVAVVASIIAVAVFGWSDDLPVVGAMPRGFPSPSLEGVTLDDVISLIGPAVGIALIAFADTSVLSRTFAARAGDQVNGSQEMAAIGTANIATGFLSGFAISASSSRTPVAEQAGAKSQLAAVVGALLIVVFIFVAPGVTAYLPSAALAAVVIAAAISLIDISGVVALFRANWVEGALSIAAFLGVALIGVLQGILVAIGLSFIAFVNLAWRPYRTELGRVPGLRGYHDVTRHPEAERIDGVLIIRFDAPLFFANGGMFDDYVRGKVREARTAGRELHTVIIAAEPIVDIDATAVDELVELDDYLRSHGITLVFAEMKDPVRDILRRYDLRVDGRPRFDDTHFAPTTGAKIDEITGQPRRDVQKSNDGI